MATIKPLVDWSRELLEINISEETGPEKEIDSGDHVIGTLEDDLKAYWVFLQRRETRIQEMLRKYNDISALHRLDHELLGDKISPESCSEHDKAKFTLLSGQHDSIFAYGVNKRIFDELLEQSYYPRANKPVLGIRRGFVVVCRDNDDRGDGKNALDPIIKLKIDDCRRKIARKVLEIINLFETTEKD